MSEKYSFADELRFAEKEYQIGGGDTFKFVDWDNKIRVLSPGKRWRPPHLPEEYHTLFWHGRAAVTTRRQARSQVVKFVMWLLDRKDGGKVKLGVMPLHHHESLAGLQNNPDYEFDGPSDCRTTSRSRRPRRGRRSGILRRAGAEQYAPHGR